jgi:PAS domain S-box-containing protein
MRGLRKDGAKFPLEARLGRIETAEGPAFSCAIRDITERQRAEAEMAERHRLETLVAEVGVALTGAESLRQGLQQCAEILVRDINAALARIWTVNEEDKVLELQASAGMYTHLDGGHARVPMGQFKIGRIAENGEPHWTNTVQQDSWVGDPEWARREGMAAFAGYPLKVEERVLGVVAAFARKPLTPATLQAFASVAHNLAQFIKRKRAEETLRESEEKYRALIETTGTGYVIIDTQGSVIDANPEYVRLTGRRALHEILGRRVTEWTAQHDLARNAEAVRRCAELGFVRNLELEYVNGDGKCTPIEVNATVVPAAGGVRIVSLCRDITERKRAEQALRESEERYRLLFERNLAGVFRGTLLSQRILDCNVAYACILGYDSRQEALSRGKLRDFYEPAEFETAKARLLNEKVLTNFEVRLRRKDQTPVWVLANVSLIEAGEAEESLVAGTLIDITERKQAEQALAQERGLLRALMDNLPDHIYFKDRQSRFLRTNMALAKAFRLSDPGQAVGKTDFDFFTAEHAQQAYSDEQEVVTTGKPMTAKEEKETWPDGRVTWVSTTKMPFRDANRAIIGTFGVSRDITERKRAEQALRESEARYRRLFEQNLAGVFRGTVDGHVLDCNDAYARMLGYNSPQEILHLEKLDYFYDAQEGMAAVARLRREGSHTNFELRLKRRDGSPISVLANVTLTEMGESRLLLVEGTLIDITIRKRAEEARAFLASLVESSQDAIIGTTLEGLAISWNHGAEELYGYRVEEMIGKSVSVLIPPDRPDELPQLLEKVRRGDSLSRYESVWARKDGSRVAVSLTISPVYDTTGKITGIATIARDIGERKRAEQQTRLQTAALESAANGIVIADREGRVLWANPAFACLTGYPAEEVLGQTLRVLKSGKHDATFYQKLWKTILSGGVWQGEIVNRRKDGTLYTDETTITPVRDALGAISHFIAVKQDVTERKRAERALEERTTYLNTLIDISPLGIVVLDTEERVQMSNPAFEKLFLYSRREMQGVNLDELIIPRELVSEAEGFTQRCLRGVSVHATSRRRRKDGTLVDLEIYAVPLVMEGKPRGILALYQDITERKHAEEALRASEERYRELFENASDLVYTTDLEGGLTSLNRVAEQTLAYSREEAAQMNFRQLVDPRHWQRVEQTRERLLAGDSAVTLELEITAKDGRRVMLEVNPRLIYKDGKPVGMQGIGRDITGRDEREMELRHAQKLESVGRLASGIAHEINTPIQFVGDNTRFVQDSFGGLQTLLSKYQELRAAAASGTVSPDLLAAVRRVEEESDCAYLLEEIPKALTQTLDGVTRVATLVRAMKDFAHPESKEKAAADLNKALLSTLAVARNELKCVADVETDLGDLPPVVCNIGDLNQVFLNLLVNAAHAIGDVVKGTGKKGKIRVRTVAEGKTVLVTIADTGCGIPEGIRTKVFDPFFTTKEVGRGTGQGLAIARSVVVERHKGTLTFESEVGKGTSFYVRLPVESEEYSEKTRVP